MKKFSKKRWMAFLLSLVLLCTTLLSNNMLVMGADGNADAVVTEQAPEQEPESAEPLAAPDVSASPAAESEQPVMEVPAPTEAPAVTEQPVVTEAPQPETTPDAEPTEAPAQTPEEETQPEATPVPETTPEATPTPEVTEAPDADQGANEPSAEPTMAPEQEEDGMTEIADEEVPLGNGMERKEYPEYLTPQEYEDGKYGNPAGAHLSMKYGAYEFKDGKWICKMARDDQDNLLGYKDRSKHYVSISNNAQANEIGYIRCDVYNGEETGEIYVPVYYISEEGESYLHHPLHESVKKGESPKKVFEELTNGYWTYGKYDGPKINSEDELKKVQDTRKPVENNDTTKCSINDRTFFIWHEDSVEKPTVEFKKVDDTNDTPISGAEFTIQNDGSTREVTSDDKGIVSFGELDLNTTYTVTETKAPDGYYTDSSMTGTITVDEEGKVTVWWKGKELTPEKDGTYEIINKRSGDLLLNKVNSRYQQLGGAEFVLTSNDDQSLKFASKENSDPASSGDANIMFENVPVGTYIMTETVVPTGHINTGESWQVEVTADQENGVVFTVKTQSGTEVEISDEGYYQIVNYSEEEDLENRLKREKTASDVNGENRLYKIDLSAWVEGVTTGKDVDALVVIDRNTVAGVEDSAEMAVKSFVNLVLGNKKAGRMADSRIAVIDTCGTDLTDGWKKSVRELEEVQNHFELPDSEQAASDLSQAVNIWNKKYRSGLEDSKNAQAVIVISDRSQAGAQPQALRNVRKAGADMDVYNIVLGTPDSEAQTLSRTLNQTADDQVYCIADKNDSMGLMNSLEDIFRKATASDSYENAAVKDYIDPRFQAAEKKKDGKWIVYTDDDVKKAGKDGIQYYDGYLKYDAEKECQYVEWSNQTIGTKESKEDFDKTIYIKAKDDFMGGNMIPTNKAESGISVGNTTVAFPMPSVNVPLLKMKSENLETTVLLGETVSPKAFAENLYQEMTVDGLENAGEVLPELTEDEWKLMIAGQGVSKDYSYGKTDDEVGSFEYSLQTVKPDTNGNLNDHKTETVGKPAEQYRLTVTYRPLETGERKALLKSKGTDITEPAALGTETTQESVAPIYSVNVVSGTIQITKDITKPAKVYDGDPIFIFKIEKLEENPEKPGETVAVKTWYQTVRLSGSETTETAVLDGLEIGTYRITEESALKYECKEVEMNTDNKCKSTVNPDGKSVTVCLGTPVSDSDEEKNPADLASVKFSNERTDSGKVTDTDVIVNRFRYDAESKLWVYEADHLQEGGK